MTQKQFLTPEGLEKLTAELQQLKVEKRRELANRIQEAKELGDLSENAEYQEAKNEQSFVEGRILEIEMTLKSAEVIQPSNSGTAQVGSHVTIAMAGKSHTYHIVGSNEADPTNGRISNVSPLGQAFLGRKAGDTASIATPSGEIEAKITKVA
ncbi:MAG: transcription elongation factor GreA [Patescibacteria group bacterium]|jgi:transcription elongation factor GreA